MRIAPIMVFPLNQGLVTQVMKEAYKSPLSFSLTAKEANQFIQWNYDKGK